MLWFWKRIKTLKFSGFISLFKLFFSKPLLLWPSLKATSETLRICDEKFGKKHRQNNSTNAFRHALWNYLICEGCHKKLGDMEKTLQFSEKLTGLHEKLAPNPTLEKAMDLHNNKIGRWLFEKDAGLEKNIVPVLIKMMADSIKITKVEDLKQADHYLVFIET